MVSDIFDQNPSKIISDGVSAVGFCMEPKHIQIDYDEDRGVTAVINTHPTTALNKILRNIFGEVIGRNLVDAYAETHASLGLGMVDFDRPVYQHKPATRSATLSSPPAALHMFEIPEQHVDLTAYFYLMQAEDIAKLFRSEMLDNSIAHAFTPDLSGR